MAVVGSGSSEYHSLVAKAFERRLRELGHEPGRDVVVDYVWMETMNWLTVDQFSRRVERIVKKKAAVIVAGSNLSVTVAMAATKTIPIVMATTLGDPVALGFVDSWDAPRGNVTGLADTRRHVSFVAGGVMSTSDSSQALIERLKAAVPGAQRVALLLRHDNPTHRSYHWDMVRAGQVLGVTVVPVYVAGAAALAASINAAVEARVDGLIVPPDLLFGLHLQEIAQLALAKRLPAISAALGFASVGGLLSYGVDGEAAFAAAATYVDRILRGASAGSLPLQSHSAVRFYINLQTARRLGVQIPESVLAEATRVIE